MSIQNYLLSALENVLNWDIADEHVPLAINDQAKLMAGFDAEELWLEVYD